MWWECIIHQYVIKLLQKWCANKLTFTKPFPGKTSHYAILLLVHRLRRWPKIKSALIQNIVLAGFSKNVSAQKTKMNDEIK